MADIATLLADPHAWVALLTLSTLEIVLGIDNIVVIAILTARLPPERQPTARRTGIALALITRLGLLGAISWIMHLTHPVASAFGQDFSWRDIILIAGGLFLVYKGTVELHERSEGGGGRSSPAKRAAFASIVAQIVVVDIVFSLDSVITAVGMASDIRIMCAAVVIAVLIMLVAATPLSDFIHRHPTVKVLALAFLLMIGMVLIAEGFEFHVPAGYVYAAMAFSVAVEAINLAKRQRPTA